MSTHETSVGPKVIQRAKAIRAERDTRLRNGFPVEAHDRRWIGDLGELVFWRWLQRHDLDFEHHGEDADADFTVGRLGLALKTRDRPDALVAKRHAEAQGFDFLVFAHYEPLSHRWRLLGAITAPEFLLRATLHPAKTADGQPYYLMPAAHLYPPEFLLRALKREAAT